MKKMYLVLIVSGLLCSTAWSQSKSLFKKDLSNADYKKSVWKMTKGVLSAEEDNTIFTNQQYENFHLTLEFKNDHGTNSGVIIYCTDKKNWIPNSVEVQIADDYYPKFKKNPAHFTCGAIFGHLAPSESVVKKAGEWNKMALTCRGQDITVEINGKKVTHMDMSQWTSGKKNPDGSEIPSWLPKPFASLSTKGYIGFQGKHGEAKIYFRNIKISSLN